MKIPVLIGALLTSISVLFVRVFCAVPRSLSHPLCHCRCSSFCGCVCAVAKGCHAAERRRLAGQGRGGLTFICVVSAVVLAVLTSVSLIIPQRRSIACGRLGCRDCVHTLLGRRLSAVPSDSNNSCFCGASRRIACRCCCCTEIALLGLAVHSLQRGRWSADRRC